MRTCAGILLAVILATSACGGESKAPREHTIALLPQSCANGSWGCGISDVGAGVVAHGEHDLTFVSTSGASWSVGPQPPLLGTCPWDRDRSAWPLHTRFGPQGALFTAWGCGLWYQRYDAISVSEIARFVERPDGDLSADLVTSDGATITQVDEMGIATAAHDGAAWLCVSRSTEGAPTELWRLELATQRLERMASFRAPFHGCEQLVVDDGGAVIVANLRDHGRRLYRWERGASDVRPISEMAVDHHSGHLVSGGGYVTFQAKDSKAIVRARVDGSDPTPLTEWNDILSGSVAIDDHATYIADGLRVTRHAHGGGAPEVVYEAPDRAYIHRRMGIVVRGGSLWLVLSRDVDTERSLPAPELVRIDL